MRELRQRSIGALDERDEQIPLFPKRFILFVGGDLFALALIPLGLLVGTDIRRVADGDVEAVADAEHGFGIKVTGAAVGLVRYGGAKQDADGGTFVWFAHVAVEGFEVKFHFAKEFGLELVNLQVESHQTL